jgi:RND family efflux transporter MFP subunit
MKKILIFIVLVAVVALAAMKLIAVKKEVATQATPKPMHYSVETTMAHEGSVVQRRSFLAQIKNDKEVKISTKLSGEVKKVLVSESQKVRKGDLLVKIDDTAIKTNIATLQDTKRVQEADVKYYKEVLDRNTKLYNAHAISKEKYDASVLQLQNKEAALQATEQKILSLESDLKYLNIRAPFSGVVSTIFLHEGDLASFSKPVLMLNDGKQKMVFTYAPTSEQVNKGDAVYFNGKKVGIVAKIYPDAKNNLSVAEVKLSEPVAAVNNSFVNVGIELQKQQGCKLPLQALLHEKDATYVLAFKDNKFHKDAVDVILEGDTDVLVQPCPQTKVAIGSESKLSILPFYENLSLVGSNNGE